MYASDEIGLCIVTPLKSTKQQRSMCGLFLSAKPLSSRFTYHSHQNTVWSDEGLVDRDDASMKAPSN